MKQKWMKIGAALLSSAIVISSVAVGSLRAEATEYVEIRPSVRYSYRVATPTDYVRLMTEAAGPEEGKSAQEAAKNYKSAVDNSDDDFFPEIGDQATIGSCGAWASVYYTFTHEMNKAMGRTTTHDTTFNPLFIYNLNAGGYDGSHGIFPHTAYEIIGMTGAAMLGTIPDAQNDYKTYHPQLNVWREASDYRVTSCFNFEDVGNSWNQITSADDPDLDAIKTMLRSGHVTTFCGYIYDFNFSILTSLPADSSVNENHVGEYVITHTKGTEGFHAMTIVGYDDDIWTDINGNGRIDDGEMGALKMANSWGNWRNHGYCWIAYDALNQVSCVSGVGEQPNRRATLSYICMPVINKSFQSAHIYLQYTVNSCNRDDSYLVVKAARKSDGSVYRIKTMPHYTGVRSDAVALNYEGGTDYGDGTFILELDNIVSGLNSDNFNDYNWSVDFVDGRDGTPLTVKELFIVDEKGFKQYGFTGNFPLKVNNQTRTASMMPCYNISYLSYSPKSNVVVNSPVKIAFKTENEVRSSSKIVYNMLITRNDENSKKVYVASTKNVRVDAAARTASGSFAWTPKKAGNYVITISAQDDTGAIAVRTAAIKVFSEKLAVRSLNLETSNPISGNYVYNYDTVRLTPKVTGGTAPYTYTYSFSKGGKTYVMAENTQKSTWSKAMGNTGVYTFKVTVKDANNNTASLSRKVTVAGTEVQALEYSESSIYAGGTLNIKPHLRNLSNQISSKITYQYTFTDPFGFVTTQAASRYSSTTWKPIFGGEHKINLKVMYESKVLTEYTDTYEVKGNSGQRPAGMTRIHVNVIEDVCKEYDNYDDFAVRFWNDADAAGEVKCVAKNTTKTKKVGFWNGEQTFIQFYVDVPQVAVGYKFHIGDRWFPAGTEGNGNLKTNNTVYVFNYNYDRCLYTKE